MLLPREPTSRPRIIAAPPAAAREGEGVAVIDGRLVGSLHVVEAERQAALADAIAALGG